MTERSFMATHDLIAVSANLRETEINVEQTLDTTMLWELGAVINKEPRRSTNANEASGKEEADIIYDLGSTAGVTLTADKAQPQHFAFLFGYGLGSVSSAAAGTGKEHTITPIDGDLDGNRSNPSFTAAQRYGKTVLKRQFASMFVDSVTATLARDQWAKISGVVKGTGKTTDNITEETINAYADATSLTLASAAVQGADASTRLQNVQQIKVELTTGVWTEVAYSAVSGATPAVINITSPGGGHVLKDYKVLYIPTESGWMTFPARVNETPLRISEMTLTVGGVWTGSAFSGGRSWQSEMKQIALSVNNNTQVQFVPGAGGLYASRAQREGRLQKIKLDREFREFILQKYLDNNATFGLHALLEGAVYDTPHKYQVDIVYPQLGLLSVPIDVDGKRLAEAGDLQVLENDTYGSVIVKVKNLQATYAA